MPETEKTTYAFILGSHPDLSLAELNAVLPLPDGAPLTRSGTVAFYKTADPLDADALMETLGGCIKIVEMAGVFDEEKLLDWLMNQVDRSTKFNYGFSLYPADRGIKTKKHWKTLHKLGLQLKKSFKEQEISVRFVESREVILSSVIVRKERLLKNGVDIVLLKDNDGMRFGKTLATQPFGEFSRRDYGRPERDARSGMLPPKVARMMVNIAQPKKDSVVLDPFCGSGTIPQEALLLGYANVIGNDISEKAVEDTRKNLEWMKLPEIPLHVSPAEELVMKSVLDPYSVDRIVFEGYLGPPSPKEEHILKIKKELAALYTNAFPVLFDLLKEDGRVVAALPFWRFREDHHLDIPAIIKRAGFVMDAGPWFYRRPQSTVGREIVRLKKA
ncbi:MAG: methyltransferase domain-containing protein [Candidatus Kerfeldbacteria bacterium]